MEHLIHFKPRQKSVKMSWQCSMKLLIRSLQRQFMVLWLFGWKESTKKFLGLPLAVIFPGGKCYENSLQWDDPHLLTPEPESLISTETTTNPTILHMNVTVPGIELLLGWRFRSENWEVAAGPLFKRCQHNLQWEIQILSSLGKGSLRRKLYADWKNPHPTKPTQTEAQAELLKAEQPRTSIHNFIAACDVLLQWRQWNSKWSSAPCRVSPQRSPNIYTTWQVNHLCNSGSAVTQTPTADPCLEKDLYFCQVQALHLNIFRAHLLLTT